MVLNNMGMKNNILILITILTFASCTNKESSVNCSNDLSDEVLTLNGNNKRLLELVKSDKRNKSIIKITIELHKAAEILMDKAGGLNRSGRFIDRFNSGYLSDTLLDHIRKNVNIIVREMNPEDFILYKKNEPILTSAILDKESIYYISSTKKTYLEIALALLVVENSLLVESVR